jgi:predicted nucleotidyltransferase
MRRAEAIAKLQEFEPRLRALGAAGLYLFGSTARGEATARSDVDLFMDLEPASLFSAFDLVEVKLLIEDELGVSVDLSTRKGLHPLIRAAIESEAVKVF